MRKTSSLRTPLEKGLLKIVFRQENKYPNFTFIFFNTKYCYHLLHLIQKKRMELQSLYQNAIEFAGEKHYSHKMPAVKANYLVHLSNVAMEVLIASFYTKNFDVNFAVQVAILHDTLEDTDTSFMELETEFGSKIAQGVLALTKDEYVPLQEQMTDSIARIKAFSHEVWAVKLADRITNLQTPPSHWHKDRTLRYKNESDLIYKELKDGNSYLAKRLKEKIKLYAL